MKKIIAEFFGSQVVNYGPEGKKDTVSLSPQVAKLVMGTVDRMKVRPQVTAKPVAKPVAKPDYKPDAQALDGLIKMYAIAKNLRYDRACVELQAAMPDVFRAAGYR